MTKKTKIFISHSSMDIAYVEKIVKLLNSMGLNQKQIFCSSMPKYDIPLGKDIFEYLREQFSEFSLHIIFIHSDNYYKSAVCLNEMGAAWVLRSEFTSILLPGFDFDRMTGVLNNRFISIKLDGQIPELQNKFDQLYETLINEFNLQKNDAWENKRDLFINEIQKMEFSKNNDHKISPDAKELLEAAASYPSKPIIISSTLAYGTTVQAGKKTMNQGASMIESTKWIAALDELVNAGFVLQTDSTGKIFSITSAGIRYVEENWVVQVI